MASILLGLVPPVKSKPVETRVNSLTPTMIADVYMDSKVNSVRMAQLRGYEVSEEEDALVGLLLTLSRSEAHRLFIEHFTENNYLSLSSLNGLYRLREDREDTVDIKGPQRRILAVNFYSSDGPVPANIKFENDMELVIVGLTGISPTIEQAIRNRANEYNNTTVSIWRVDELSLWPIENPYVAPFLVFKRGVGVEDLPSQRGAASYKEISDIRPDDVIGRLYGVEPGDVVIEKRLIFDTASMAKISFVIRSMK